jgi:hypothetical protein
MHWSDGDGLVYRYVGWAVGVEAWVGAVVEGAPLGVAERFVGDGDGVESLAGGGVVRVDVGVGCAGGAPVGAVDLSGGGASADVE